MAAANLPIELERRSLLAAGIDPSRVDRLVLTLAST
jgi:hypothetical protein